MQEKEKSASLLTLTAFGDLLKYLRKRAQLTQRELAIAVGYSEAHLNRLEKNQRLPDLATVAALFIPALGLEEEPETAAQLLQLAADARGSAMGAGKSLMISRTQEITEISESAESIPSNLPLQLTSFIGRQEEISEITRLLSGTKPTRLVTLTGPGGIGKTRLALQATISYSNRYQDGIWFVDLAPLSSPEMIPQTVASALNVPGAKNLSFEQTLIAHLRAKQMLILLDNCEHLVHAVAGLVEKILRSCAHVQILAASRESLNVPGEVNFQVLALSLPEEQDDASQTVMGHEAVQLFIERARNIQHSFALTDSNAGTIARICRRLDGMPLAIELAAARTSLLSLSQIEARLKDRFQLLIGGHTTLPRHQTLRATIEWSHDLLSEAEKNLFRRLAVFAGGWTLDSANFVCATDTNDVLDLLAQLVNKSLVVVESQPAGEVRYRMLETIREYAGEQLRASDEMESLRARHFDYFLQMAQQAEPKLFAADSSIDWAEAEIDNLRAALTWALEAASDKDSTEERTGPALGLIAHVWPLWLSRGYSMEGDEWLNRLLSVHTAPTLARARALLLAGDLAGYHGNSLGKAAFVQESLVLARKLGDKKRIAWSSMEMGLVERDLRHYSEAVEFMMEGLAEFEELKDNLWVCRSSFLLAETYIAIGNMAAAKPVLEHGLDLCRAENDKWQLAWGLEVLGNVERLEERLEQARQYYTKSLHLRMKVMDRTGIAYALEAFAQLAAAQKHFERAVVLWGAVDQLRQKLNLLSDPLREDLRSSPLADARAQLGEEEFAAAQATQRVWRWCTDHPFG